MGVGVRRGKVPSPLAGSREGGVEGEKVVGAVEETEEGELEEVEEGRGVVRTRVKFSNKEKEVRVNQTHQQFRVMEEDVEPRQKPNGVE